MSAEKNEQEARAILSAFSSEEALSLLRSGPSGIDEWNRRHDVVNHAMLLHLWKPDFSGMDLQEVDPGRANLLDVNFRGARLRGAILAGSKLIHADLSHADLRDADLSNAQLNQTDLARANLMRADLAEADLSEANLEHADLRNSDLLRHHLA